MHTLLLTDAFLPHAGGSRIYYFNLYRRLAQDYGERVTVLTRKSPGWEAFDQEVAGNLRIQRCGHRAAHVKVSQWPTFVPYFAQAFKTWAFGHVDVMHTGDLFPPGVCGAMLNRLSGMPYVTYCHGEEIPQTAGYRYQPRVRNWVYQNASAVVANSKFTREKLLEIGVDGNKVHVITPGVDWEHFTPAEKNPEMVRRYGLEGKVVLLTVGRLVARKGHGAVLKALARLQDLGQVRYIIAGIGEEEQRLKKLVGELGLSETVIFTGYVAEHDLPKLFHTCDVFVTTNYEQPNGDLEGFGMVFLEANAAGKPVIAGRSGGTADAVQDGITGFLVDPLQSDELLLRLRQLLSDKELRRGMGVAGRKRVCTEFDWKSRAAALRDINLSIAGDKKWAPAINA
jgi:phosphatidylinositol alpha-1,6-mannosyltransferase